MSSPYMKAFGPITGVELDRQGKVVGPALIDPATLPDRLLITLPQLLAMSGRTQPYLSKGTGAHRKGPRNQ